MDSASPASKGVTAALAASVVALRLEDVPERARRAASLALLDWYAVTMAGVGIEPVPMLTGDAQAEASAPAPDWSGNAVPCRPRWPHLSTARRGMCWITTMCTTRCRAM
ncbi:hypothetical protein ACFQFQ_27660 [Sulfitobacter porphyrae]|uniref:Uncharacterized protein n=1 Tax=Sulfitobacter porphyrae TaxID=1246864 RepID=A0ABW2BAL9_9RHOB